MMSSVDMGSRYTSPDSSILTGLFDGDLSSPCYKDRHRILYRLFLAPWLFWPRRITPHPVLYQPPPSYNPCQCWSTTAYSWGPTSLFRSWAARNNVVTFVRRSPHVAVDRCSDCLREAPNSSERTTLRTGENRFLTRSIYFYRSRICEWVMSNIIASSTTIVFVATLLIRHLPRHAYITVDRQGLFA